jgi:hypothetical protein
MAALRRIPESLLNRAPIRVLRIPHFSGPLHFSSPSVLRRQATVGLREIVFPLRLG